MKRSELKVIIKECIQELNERKFYTFIGKRREHVSDFFTDLATNNYDVDEYDYINGKVTIEYYGGATELKAIKKFAKKHNLKPSK